MKTAGDWEKKSNPLLSLKTLNLLPVWSRITKEPHKTLIFILNQDGLSLSRIPGVTVINVIFLISLVFVLTGACISSYSVCGAQDEISFLAEVKWISLEGGFFGLVTEDGRKFLPLNLPEEFKKKGLKVRVKGNIKKDIATVQMWGMPFEIREIDIHRE